MDVPKVDARAKKTLSEIAAVYPDLIEKHSEFLLKLGVSFDESKSSVCALNKDDAEKIYRLDEIKKLHK